MHKAKNYIYDTAYKTSENTDKFLLKFTELLISVLSKHYFTSKLK